MARPRLEANRGGVTDFKICFAVFVGVALGVLVSLLQLGGESKQWLSQLRTTADAANLARDGQVRNCIKGVLFYLPMEYLNHVSDCVFDS